MPRFLDIRKSSGIRGPSVRYTRRLAYARSRNVIALTIRRTLKSPHAALSEVRYCHADAPKGKKGKGVGEIFLDTKL